MTTTYTYNFADGSQVTVSYDETGTQTTSPPNGYAITAISGTWQGVAIDSLADTAGNYQGNIGGLGNYDNSIFPNFGAGGDGANSLGNLDGIDTAGIVFFINDGGSPSNDTTIQLYWDGSSPNAFSFYNLPTGSVSPTGPTGSTLSSFTACYAAGTHILTSSGEVPVEQLRVGDTVMALNNFGLAAVRWIGHRRVDITRHPRRSEIAPIRIRAHSFARDRPHRDLLLSPDHSVFVDGVLIPVRYLVNGATIAREMMDSVTYYHIELDHHDVLLAEGMPAESYLDTGNRAAFANGGSATHAHPDFALRIWATQGCAPLVTDGAVLHTVRAGLLARAAELGHGRLSDPELRLLANGRAVPLRADGARLVADLPAGTHTVRLASRSMVPAWTVADSIDHRVLGVAVQTLTLDDAPLPAAVFGAGWHQAEPALRWTDGDAVLRIGGGQLALTLLPLLAYWQAPDETPARRAA